MSNGSRWSVSFSSVGQDKLSERGHKIWKFGIKLWFWTVGSISLVNASYSVDMLQSKLKVLVQQGAAIGVGTTEYLYKHWLLGVLLVPLTWPNKFLYPAVRNASAPDAGQRNPKRKMNAVVCTKLHSMFVTSLTSQFIRSLSGKQQSIHPIRDFSSGLIPDTNEWNISAISEAHRVGRWISTPLYPFHMTSTAVLI